MSNSIKVQNYLLAKKYEKEKQEALKNGVSPHTSTARKEMIESNLELVRFAVKGLNLDTEKESYEDLLMIGTISLINAVDSYKPSEEKPFSTFAVKVIRNDLVNHMIKLSRAKRGGGINKVSFSDIVIDYHNREGAQLTIEEILVDDEINIEEDFIEKEVLREEYDNVLYNLAYLPPNYQKALLLSSNFRGEIRMTDTKVAEYMQISKVRVSQLKASAKERMRLLMNPPEELTKEEEKMLNKMTKSPRVICEELESIYLSKYGEDYPKRMQVSAIKQAENEYKVL